MKITEQRDGLIITAETDDGTISYSPAYNRLTIDGRQTHWGHFCDPVTGKLTDERITASQREAAASLMREVDAACNEWQKQAREASWAAYDARNPGIPANSSFWVEDADEKKING